MFYLMLRIRFESGQFGHKLLWSGTRDDCEREAWYTNIESFRGPGVVEAELIVIDQKAWSEILKKQVKRRG